MCTRVCISQADTAMWAVLTGIEHVGSWAQEGEGDNSVHWGLRPSSLHDHTRCPYRHAHVGVNVATAPRVASG